LKKQMGLQLNMKQQMGKSSLSLLLPLSVAWLVSVNVALAQNLPEGSFALVNGQPLSDTLLDVSLQASVQRGQAFTPQLRERLVDELIGQEVFAQEARNLKLDQTPQAQAAFTQVQKNFLGTLLVENFVQTNPVTSAQIQAQYDLFLKEMANAKQYKLGIITVESPDRAKAIIAELQSSKDKGLFAKIAQTESIDNSASNGGELDWLLPQQMLPAVGNVVVNLTKGQLSAVPIQTRAGWNVVRLDETKDYAAPTLKEIEPDLRQAASQRALAEYLQGLRVQSKIVQ
jgi:peptidyl-prolyl cis-trans isomerase C